MDWAAILLPSLALDCVLRTQTTPQHPLALIDGPVQRRRLLASNPAAQALGWRAGMSLNAAQAIGGEVRCVSHDPTRDQRMLALLATWAYRYSSQVHSGFPQALVLEIGRSRQLFGEWPQIEARLREELTALGMQARLCAAPNPWAAHALALNHDGLALDHGTFERALGQLAVEHCGLPEHTVTPLQRMGLRHLRLLFEMPRDALNRRFGPDLLRHIDRLRGFDRTPLLYYQPPDRFDQRIEFEQETDTAQALLFPLRRLTGDLAAYLGGRDGGVQRFLLRLEHEQRADSRIEVGLLAPEREAALLFELARGRIEQARLPAAVRGLRLVAEELPPFVPADRDLFDSRPQQAVPWPQLRERLRARLGDKSVHGLGIRADHRPEHVVSSECDDGGAVPMPVPRPGWLLDRPIPLRERVARVLSGPERIESGWWDGDDVRRDYYRIEIEGGQQAWVFCAAGEQGPFMLHGWFA